jgi:YidC/Oxa1 family membrane protein insertase
MLMNIMPIGMALITMLQPATIQFYFFCSSTLGLLTGRALRSPYVRRVMRISALPTKESHEVFSKIIQEKKPLQSIRGKDGKIVYQAPITPSSNINRPSNLNLKPGTKVPGHYAPVGSEKEKASLKMEEEFQRGMPKTDRTSWVATHYQPKAVIQRLRKTMSKPEPEPVVTEGKSKPRVTAGRRDFEAERRKFKKSK